MIELTDSTIRAYRRKRGGSSLRLRSYLVVRTTEHFDLDNYLREIRCWISLPSEEERECEMVKLSKWVAAEYNGQHLLHSFCASMVVPNEIHIRCVAILRLMYHISFTGHPAEAPVYQEYIAPIVPIRSTLATASPRIPLQQTGHAAPMNAPTASQGALIDESE